MRVMILVKATADSEAGGLPDPALMEAMGLYNEELMNAGVLLAGEGLKPTREGRRVRFDGDRREVADGPFAPATEQVAGFWLWQVRDLAEAVDWLKRCPNPMPGPSEVEIRPLFEAEDFVTTMPESVAVLEQDIRDRLADR
jgi:hypothetical protein